MTIRLYHPNLEPPHNECEVLDERQARVLAESGWLAVPEPEKRPGYEPEPVAYEPVTLKKQQRTSKSSESESTDK